jgi:glycogen phosphorylase
MNVPQGHPQGTPAPALGDREGRAHVRTGTDPETLAQAIVENLYYALGRVPQVATRNDWYTALALTVRDRMLQNWVKTADLLHRDVKVVSYLSAEFLMGPHLGNALVCLGIQSEARQAADQLGLDLDELLDQEEEPGLGNGGLGRLAACYLDSLSTLRIPALGYGIRYEFGIFDQAIRDGWQVEVTDKWLRFGNPWEIARPEMTYDVGLGGHTEAGVDEQGRYRVRWIPARVVKGMAYDTPVPGYRVDHVCLLRLWKAEAVESFDFADFNVGNYWEAVQEKIFSETITKVLYPNDEPEVGKKLRLLQQYFFVSCSLQDMLRIHLQLKGSTPESFHDGFAVQLNDTHPSIAVAELMRLLVDVHGLAWEPAWKATQAALAYTNHTLLPEALEKWPLAMFAEILPRHLEIIHEINRRFLDAVRVQYPGDEARVARLSIIDETGSRSVRMAHLACVGSHAINGVAALHSELLRETVLRDFAALWPAKFCNVTNGVTPRRWVVLANPQLARLITDSIGSSWVRHAEELERLEPLAQDAAFRRAWRDIKQENKQRLAAVLLARTGIGIDPQRLFDVQVKRLHEYKRQLLNVLHAITLYNRLRERTRAAGPPRTILFAGKAAPGYFTAKLIIKLIHSVAETIAAEPLAAGHLQVVFIPDFNVKNAQPVYPAADLSEQISTAGLEASGTGNMKFAMNGALTIGTLDGANVEIRTEVGAENFFLFGLTAEEVQQAKSQGYRPREHYEANPELRLALDQIANGHFSGGDTELFRPLVEALLSRDEYLLLADFPAYVACQERVGAAYEDAEDWTRRSILNVARIGKFSSDRAIREYCDKIWNAKPLE